MKKQLCPSCGRMIEVQHNGMHRRDEVTDPWIFVQHNRLDTLSGEPEWHPCPGSRKNQWMAENS